MENFHFKPNETAKNNTGTDNSLLLAEIRQAFADYRQAEGCSCCRNITEHEKAEKRLAELLNPAPYDDNIGFDWSQYCTK